MICSCKVPKWGKAVRTSALAACQRYQVLAAVAQTCRGASGRRKVGPDPVFPMEKQGKTHRCGFDSALAELAAVGEEMVCGFWVPALFFCWCVSTGEPF